jgi:Flp pilus assembly protein TadG
MAAVFFLFIMMLGLLLFWGRVFWYNSMAQKAAQDAARFLSRATPVEMQTRSSRVAEAPVAAVARWIVHSEVGALYPVMDPYWIYVQCGVPNNTNVIVYGNCGSSIPQTVRVSMRLGFKDELVPDILMDFFGMKRYTFKPDVTMRYVGN